ncbi:FG-GAP-like repeat-containing protein [Flexithrix dorotheae]|uniref:FG-GAP-like repeat-containing protein n=1 Tax=Flexithrix dorotheae TaxID=70993 RepID=UPI0003756B85|nr:FG-GAP-like repeat-containing protein [Flexithrix dorotheae]
MTKNFITLLLLSVAINAFAQFEKNQSASDSLMNLVESSADWGDYDQDGDLDLAICGTYGTMYTIVYRNDNGKFININAGLQGVSEGNISWGDFDDDNDLDLLLTGIINNGFESIRITKIYRNDDGTFVPIEAGLTGFSEGTSKWGDYDQDGDLDIALIGRTDEDGTKDLLKVYRNDMGMFVEMDLPIQPTIINLHGSVSWGDYDNDEDLDLLVTGLGYNQTNDDFITRILRNDHGIFKEDTTELVGVVNGKAEWNDHDMDGDLDIAILGERFDLSFVTAIYNNDGQGTFIYNEAPFHQVSNGSIDWGDYDNDGDSDLLITGIQENTYLPVTNIYTNNNGEFDSLQNALPGVWGTANWADYDQDGDLDILISGLDEMYTNEFTVLFKNMHKLNQTINFEPIQDRVYGDSSFNLKASASSNLPISYHLVSGSVSITGEVINITGVGDVVIEARQTGNHEYDSAKSILQTFSILKKELIVVADSQSIYYGEPLPDFTFSYHGFAYGEDSSVLDSLPVISTTASAESDAGNYDIILNGGKSDNYDNLLVNGSLTIKKSNATINIEDLEHIFDGTVKTPLITTIPEGLNYTVTYNGDNTLPQEAGEYEVKVIIEDKNYIGIEITFLNINTPLGLQNEESKPKILIYPNPSDEIIFLSGKILPKTSVQIHSLDGKMLLNELTFERRFLNIEHIPSGTYILSLQDQLNKQYFAKTIVID